MKLMIDIPEEYLKTIKAIPDETSSLDMLLIKYGTPFDSVIEDITHEIRKYLEDVCINENEAEGIMFCLDVMDKHIGKETDNE